MNALSTAETEKSHSLGVAGWMARAFITSPLSLLLLLSFFVIGILGLLITPRQEDPQISVPMVDVFVQYPGASVKEVEGLVARPLEGILSEMTGVEHVYSISSYGQAMVTVQFEVGQDLEASLVKLYDKLSSNRDRIPLGAHDPLVKPKGVDDVPVVTITLWSNEVDDAQLRLIGLDVTQKLREVNNTSQSFMVSGRRESVQVEILPERLATFGVTLDQVARIIQAANSEYQVGRVESTNRVYQVYSGAFLNSADEIKRLMVAVINGRPVYVQDIAEVKQGPGDASSMVGYYTGAAYPDSTVKADDAAAVTIAIAKKNRTNGVDVSQAVLKRLETLKGQIIPDNVNVAITRDYGDTARVKVNDLIKKLFIATGIVTLLVCLALGVRAGTVVLLVIPSVITTTVFATWALGMTIDRVSLFALIFSIGILVDDAIVVVENIYRRWLLAGNQDLDIAVDAVREVGNPTILATATVIAALLPMGFVSGMMGPYMQPIPILGSIAMIISLFAAFAFTPWLTNLLKPSLAKLHHDAEKEHKLAQYMEHFFRALLTPLVERKSLGYLVLFSIIGVFFAAILLMYPLKAVSVKMLPLDNKPEFNVVVNLPEGTALPVTANLVHELAVKIQPIAEITALQSYIGTASPFNFNGLVRHYYLRQQPWQADIQVQLVDKSQRKRTSHQIALEVRDLLTPLVKAAQGSIEVVEMPPGPPVLQTVVAEVYGPDDEVRRQVAKDLTGFFEQAENLTDIRNLMETDYNVVRFEVDESKVQRASITVQEINQTLEMVLGNFIVGDIKNVRSIVEPTAIILQIPLNVRSQMMRLAQLPLRNAQGKLVPLHELGAFKQVQQDKPIFHKDLRPVEFVTAEGTGRLAAPVYGQKQVEQLVKDANYTAPDGTVLADEFYWLREPSNVDSKTAVVWGGEWTVTFETFRDMGMAFGAALILIYMLIVAQFGNFILPAIIMAPIPLTLVGIIPGHWMMGAEFTATSMIGFIALAGIIVRNSILLVDFARDAVNNGSTVMDAVIHSCEVRTRPILITALALLGGSSVIISDPIFQGMAVSLIFGGAVSTLLTLIIIPLGCISAGRSLGSGEAKPNPESVNQSMQSKGKLGSMLKSIFSYTGLYLWLLIISIGVGILDLLRALQRLIKAKLRDKSLRKIAK
ncbi:efflux RND transporter permease subunit [Thiofilum flexile]|uniref:efflux RND transporter permease subunit n=1 Tax=Thiofilum flexile TaxID=125627 RepID=UPI00036ADE07|nr:efflux RND transporter permease subunit [Thiofilum flexile]